MFAIAQTADLLLEQACELFLPFDERPLSCTLSIQEQQVEGEEDKLIGSAFMSDRARRIAVERHIPRVRAAGCPLVRQQKGSREGKQRAVKLT
jgi:hypothetical protein